MRAESVASQLTANAEWTHEYALHVNVFYSVDRACMCARRWDVWIDWAYSVYMAMPDVVKVIPIRLIVFFLTAQND